MIWVITVALAVGVFLYQVICLILDRGRTEITELRLNEIATMGIQSQEKIRRWEGSLLSRAGSAAFTRLTSSIGTLLPIGAKEKEQIRRLIAQSGLTMQPEEYMAIQLLVVGGFGLACMYLGGIFEMKLVGGAIGAYCGYALFRFGVKLRATTRKEAILEQFPELLDLLSIGVGAGLGFNQAFQYIAEQCHGPLVDEFIFAGNAMALGRSRRAALEEMSHRCDIDELRMFTSAVIQADEMGISLKNILETQAREARHAKRMRIEERAQKIPIKMLLPIGLLIFPVMIIILLGPAVPRIMDALL